MRTWERWWRWGWLGIAFAIMATAWFPRERGPTADQPAKKSQYATDHWAYERDMAGEMNAEDHLLVLSLDQISSKWDEEHKKLDAEMAERRERWAAQRRESEMWWAAFCKRDLDYVDPCVAYSWNNPCCVLLRKETADER